jgi:NADH-quinone oxidoreductase subunit C
MMSSESEKETIEKKPEDSKPSDDKTSEKPAPDKTPPATKPTVAKKPTPAKEEPELPAFEKGIADKIIENFGDKATISFVKPDRVGIKVGRDSVHDVAEFARDVLNYDHVDSVAGVDYPADKEIEVVYHLSSYTDPTLSRQILELATRADIFYSVEFHEREVFEMLGVYFEGHPDNRRLLLPEDWADLPPLRKDFRNKGR